MIELPKKISRWTIVFAAIVVIFQITQLILLSDNFPGTAKVVLIVVAMLCIVGIVAIVFLPSRKVR